MSLSINERIKTWTAIQKILSGIAVFFTVFVVYWFIGYQHVKSVTPPEGYVYHAAPVLRGIYSLEKNSTTTKTKVNDEYVNCGKPGLGTAGRAIRSDTRSCCWLENELGGKMVVVQRKYLLTSSIGMGSLVEWEAPYVSKIVLDSDGRIYYERDDHLLRQEWLSASKRSVIIDAFFYALIVSICLVLYLFKYIGGRENV